MKEILTALATFRFGENFRRLVFYPLVLLVLFHVAVLIYPLVFPPEKGSVSETQIQYLQKASDSVANITVALILILIIIHGQDSLSAFIQKRRIITYLRIRKDILDWLQATRPPSFDEADDEAKFIYGTKDTQEQVLQHLKVMGSPSRLMTIYHFPDQAAAAVKAYSESVHFELTRYPAELLYGIHFEIDDYAVSQELSQAVARLLNLPQQCDDIKPDTKTPKKPGWVFLTRSVELSGDIDKDYAQVMTHARHFVELVCHSYDSLYSKPMLELYLELMAAKH